MAIPKMPARAWVQIAAMLALFFVALIASHRLWAMGEHPVAAVPLFLYGCLTTAYSAYIRVHRV